MENFIKKLLTVIVFLILCMLATKLFYKQAEEIERPKDETEDIDKIVTETMEKYYTYVFEYHSSNYCKKLKNDGTNENSKTYNTIEELKNYYKTFLSEKYIEENLSDKYIEEDNKLYCSIKKTSTLEYKENSFKIENIENLEDELNIEGTYETNENDLNPSETFYASIILIKENNNWVIDSYKES